MKTKRMWAPVWVDNGKRTPDLSNLRERKRDAAQEGEGEPVRVTVNWSFDKADV